MTEARSEPPVFLEGDNVFLRPLMPGDASDAYLAWLNDPEVLRYSGRKVFPSTRADLQRFLDSLSGSGDLVLAICQRQDGRHVGNIALNTIIWQFGSAELSVMVGAKDIWGKGYGGEAIELVTAHAFGTMGLRRLWAESPNPGFNAIMARLGWTQEGIKREAFLLEGEFVDFICWSILKREYPVKPKRAGEMPQ